MSPEEMIKYQVRHAKAMHDQMMSLMSEDAVESVLVTHDVITVIFKPGVLEDEQQAIVNRMLEYAIKGIEE